MHRYKVLKSRSGSGLEDEIANFNREGDYLGVEVVGYSTHVEPPVAYGSNQSRVIYSAMIKVYTREEV